MVAAVPPVFWICGASGVGKSVAAWTLFETLAAEGFRVAYVDIDQLGMLYPAGSDDPERHLLKAEAMLALLPGCASAGAQVLVVSGVVDPRLGPGAVVASDVDLTLCLLWAEPATVRERILARGWDEADADAAVADNVALRTAEFVDATVDTARLSVQDTVERLRELVEIGESPVEVPPLVVSSPAELPVVVVTGPRAVGSSTVGFGLAMTRWSAQLCTGFVDLQQLSLLGSPDQTKTSDSVLMIVQLAAMHAFFAARGAGLLVVSGHLGVADRGSLRAALPMAPVTVVRLRSDAATLEGHVRARFAGSGARLAGDDLLGAESSYRDSVVAASITEQEHLDAHATDDASVDVTGRTPTDVVAEVERITGREDPRCDQGVAR